MNETNSANVPSVGSHDVLELPAHPCYVGDGEFDHNWEGRDDSFDHELGTEVVRYLECTECGATDEDTDYYGLDDDVL